ncbi:MAG: methyltransferase domain-containing protein [Gemmatimonadales bacterium]|nr:methyltransferase domain-containing protein [Gemmatimonadales bacterium]
MRAAIVLLVLQSAGPPVRPPAPLAAQLPAADRPIATIVSPEWSDEATRDRQREAATVLDLLGVRPGVRVADLGAGLGYYAVRVARRVGKETPVYAEDILPEYLDRLRARVRKEGLAQVQVIAGTPDDPRLPAASLDVAILSHVYHEISEPYRFLWNLAPAFAGGGRLAILDMDRPTQWHGTPPARLRCELAAVGYREVSFRDLAPADGYLAVFEAPAERPAAGSIRGCRG